MNDLAKAVKTPYSYVLLRYIHDLSTGEFVNVGVVAYSPKQRTLTYRFKSSVSRVTSFFPGVKAQNFRRQLRLLEKGFSVLQQRGLELELVSIEDARHAAKQVLVEDDSSLQWSELRTGVTENIYKTTDVLFERLVNKYDESKSGLHRRSDQEIWSNFSRELPNKSVLQELQEKRIATTDDEVVFERAWKNGKWHCLEALSFDLSSSEGIREKAHKWLGQMTSIQDALDNHKVYFLLAEPGNRELHDAYEKAKNILSKIPVESEIVEENEFVRFGQKLVLDIEAHNAEINH